jgi:hypothetical protein
MVFIFCPVSELACIFEFNNYAKAAQLLTAPATHIRQGGRWGVAIIKPTPLKKPLIQNAQTSIVETVGLNLAVVPEKKDVAVVVQVTCNRWHNSQSDFLFMFMGPCIVNHCQ